MRAGLFHIPLPFELVAQYVRHVGEPLSWFLYLGVEQLLLLLRLRKWPQIEILFLPALAFLNVDQVALMYEKLPALGIPSVME